MLSPTAPWGPGKSYARESALRKRTVLRNYAEAWARAGPRLYGRPRGRRKAAAGLQYPR